jgi:hypothetical protein
MKHNNNPGTGLIIALGSPADHAGKMGMVAAPPANGDGSPEMGGRGNLNALSQASNTDTVPLSMLSMPDDQEQMQPPEVGDVVNYQVTGKVVAIEGACATIQRQSINGQDLPGADSGETNSDNTNPQNANQSQDGNDGQSLRNDAAGIGMLS